jgi:hypothetical protein
MIDTSLFKKNGLQCGLNGYQKAQKDRKRDPQQLTIVKQSAN